MNRTLDNATDQRTLEELIQNHAAGNHWELPKLKGEPSYWDQLMERFWKWVSSLFPQIDMGNSGIGTYMQALVVFLKILVVVLLVTGLVWVIYQLTRWGMRKAPPTRVLPPREYKKREELEDLLAAAEAAGDWALAARLAWKIFLRATEEPNAETPFEYHRRHPAAIPDINLPYYLMFAVDQKNRGQFVSWQQMLTSLEQKKGAP